jgi:hypothetical protein
MTVFARPASRPLFTRWNITPHRENAPRSQCPACAGGGTINDVDCVTCDRRGWHDADHPAPKEN